MKGGPHGGGWRPQRLGQGPREDPELFFFFFAEAHVGSVPQVNDLCGLPAGTATCSGEAPHALLFDTARGATPDELATLFQHAAAFRYDARQYAADARLGVGGERARVRLHTAGRAVLRLSPRTRAPVRHT